MKFDVRTRINEAGKREQIFSMQDCLYRVTLQEQGIARYRIFVNITFQLFYLSVCLSAIYNMQEK
jgi:hypothetical protein